MAVALGFADKRRGITGAFRECGRCGCSAGATGTEFKSAYDKLSGWLNGYLGRAIALARLPLQIPLVQMSWAIARNGD